MLPELFSRLLHYIFELCRKQVPASVPKTLLQLIHGDVLLVILTDLPLLDHLLHTHFCLIPCLPHYFVAHRANSRPIHVVVVDSGFFDIFTHNLFSLLLKDLGDHLFREVGHLGSHEWLDLLDRLDSLLNLKSLKLRCFRELFREVQLIIGQLLHLLELLG